MRESRLTRSRFEMEQGARRVAVPTLPLILAVAKAAIAKAHFE
jgi:hypothetical protein